MSADEDTELRDLIVQALAANGVLSKIKAELRASVFLALEDEGIFKDKIALVNKKLLEFASTSEGKKAISVIREFLQFFNLNFTLSVFEPEVSDINFLSREELCSELNLPDADVNSPIIVQLVKAKQTGYFQTSQGDGDLRTGDTNWWMKSDLPPQTVPKCPNELGTRISNDFPSSVEKNSVSRSNVHDSDKQVLKNSSLQESKVLHDPFYDDLPSSCSIFGTESSRPFENRQDDTSKAPDESLFGSHIKSKEAKDSDLFFGPLQSSTEDTLFANDSKQRDRKEVSSFSQKSEIIKERSLSSLRDLPALNIGSKSCIGGSNCQKTSFTEFSTSKSIEDGEESAGSENSTKSSPKSQGSTQNQSRYDGDSRENSELSIEEDIEDDVSVALDDIFSSISVGDDSTNDITVSQISNPGGYDHMESILPK